MVLGTKNWLVLIVFPLLVLAPCDYVRATNDTLFGESPPQTTPVVCDKGEQVRAILNSKMSNEGKIAELRKILSGDTKLSEIWEMFHKFPCSFSLSASGYDACYHLDNTTGAHVIVCGDLKGTTYAIEVYSTPAKLLVVFDSP